MICVKAKGKIKVLRWAQGLLSLLILRSRTILMRRTKTNKIMSDDAAILIQITSLQSWWVRVAVQVQQIKEVEHVGNVRRITNKHA